MEHRDIDKVNVQWKNFTFKNKKILDIQTRMFPFFPIPVFQYAMESQYLEMFSNERKEYLLNNMQRGNGDMQSIFKTENY